MGELLARIRAALRHSVRSNSGSTVIRLDGITLDLERRTAVRGDCDVHLTPIEFRIIALLAKHLGMVVTHRQLLVEIWGPTHERDTHYLRVYVKQLREKIEDDPGRPRHLETVWGVGYRLRA
jgi:two-component system KDP operon response regulator KdpE